MNPTQRNVLLHFLKGYWKAYSLIFFFSILIAAFEALHVALLYPILNTLLNAEPQPGRLMDLLQRLTQWLSINDPLITGCILLILITPLKGLLSIFYEFLVSWASARVLYRTKQNVLDKYADAPYAFFLENKIGRLMHYALTSPTRLAFILTRIPQLIVEFLRVCAILALLLSIHMPATLGLIAIAVLMNAASGYISRKLSYTMGKGRVEAGAMQSTLFNEWLSGIKHISVFGAKNWWLDRFDAASRRFNELYVKDATLLAAPKNLYETIAITGLFGTMLVLKLKAPESLYASLPIAGTFSMALLKMLPSLTILSRCRMEIMGSLPDVEGIHEALAMRFDRPADGKEKFKSLTSSVRIDNISFAYPQRGKVLDKLSFEIEGQKTTSIVGDSGSGKTTILNLLLGLMHPQEGRILIDNTPLADFTMRSWLDRVAVVSQDTFIFHGTIKENILFGRSGYNDDAIKDAAQIAHAHAFISEMPEGYDTTVGERGMKLSGGQQQRIAIARAILGQPEILFFDEATSALDTLSEAAVQEAIAQASQGRTVLQIAHRLSTIERSDKIVVLEKGRVGEEGTHTELLAKNGLYSRFHSQNTPPHIDG